ncbi:4Fe-4S dicluster domain-containing protein [Sporomusa acidovorans]|uniref:Pyrogallol hydroxytransferase small subunit n=1 Tax=Sporomusa acidovorans (strain ATCC 49682 / DSM 3132 / Mol) TaxID=1123286 RepID=A0ABZ3IYR7_SPOA4|nr:4Fe-4S dicluster domain-containing protein [Sporomusa acidovorans]OZC14205.1 pyrogallol hydroxytransferase small subunit [Sporomusa acidovorans DSM 3132]SDE71133.1 Fe-S-cluster-containing dehydrogenase component [Sporomusa acidovorans]
MKVFVIDVENCNGCYTCQLVCKDEHVENDWSPIAKPQPDTGHFWLKMTEKTHGQVPKVKLEYVPQGCVHCDNAPCMKAAKNEAVYKRPDGLVLIDPEKSQGQKEIVEACPYHAVYWNEALQIPQKCTGCAHLVDEGKEPRCVEACPHECIKFGEESELADLIAKAEIMLPEVGAKPRVYYVNLPKLFVAGLVYDAQKDEIIENAKVSLTCKTTGAVLQATTDDFGDFWFKKLAAGNYGLTISAQGYETYEEAIIVDQSLNVGDIALQAVPLNN